MEAVGHHAKQCSQSSPLGCDAAMPSIDLRVHRTPSRCWMAVVGWLRMPSGTWRTGPVGLLTGGLPSTWIAPRPLWCHLCPHTRHLQSHRRKPSPRSFSAAHPGRHRFVWSIHMDSCLQQWWGIGLSATAHAGCQTLRHCRSTRRSFHPTQVFTNLNQ